MLAEGGAIFMPFFYAIYAIFGCICKLLVDVPALQVGQDSTLFKVFKVNCLLSNLVIDELCPFGSCM